MVGACKSLALSEYSALLDVILLPRSGAVISRELNGSCIGPTLAYLAAADPLLLGRRPNENR